MVNDIMEKEKPKSLESQLKMARPQRAEVKRVPLTPEEKEFLGEIMDKAVAAEKAGKLQEALDLYTDYKNELMKIKEKKGKEWNRDNVIEWAKRNLSQSILNEDAAGWVDKNFEFDELPKIKTKSGLNLRVSSLDTIPNNLHVQGCLYLPGVIIQKMPEVLTVDEALGMNSAKIDALPIKLHIGRALDLSNITIDDNQIPDDIFVGGDVYIMKDTDVQIKNLLQKLKKQGKIKGHIFTD